MYPLPGVYDGPPVLEPVDKALTPDAVPDAVGLLPVEEVELREMKRPPAIAGGTVPWLELAAAILYARVLGDGGGLDQSSAIRTR